MKTALNIVVASVAIAAVLAAAWFGYWALAKKGVANQYDVNTNTQQYQAGLISQERDRVTAYDAAVDDGQKANVKTTFCAVFPDLTKPPADLVSAQARIC